MEIFMSYFFLGLTVAAEVAATTLLKYSKGFTKLLPTILCVLSYIVCYTSFSKAVTKINLGVAYATWCGLGIIVTTLVSVFVFREQMTMLGVFAIALIVIGCVILNLNGAG